MYLSRYAHRRGDAAGLPAGRDPYKLIAIIKAYAMYMYRVYRVDLDTAIIIEYI